MAINRRPFYPFCIIFFLYFVTNPAWSGHPANGSTVEMAHPSQPIPEGALVPSISFKMSDDIMDGYNLILTTQNFNILAPLVGTRDSVAKEDGTLMQGHAHLYINGTKKMRVYSHSVHVPAAWINPGINSITISINNHMHGTFTFEEKEIQSTLIIDTTADELIKNTYTWPS